ncbi:MAG: hypothetical protein Kow0031_06520 [Anaerolineae bacterium]
MYNKTFTFYFLDTPVVVDPTALASVVNAWGLGLWLGRKYPPLRQLRVSLLAALNYVAMDFIHFSGHIISSRLASAPMNEVRVKFPLPMAYFRKEDVSPEQHQLRAIGGPIASTLAALVALPLWLLSRPGSLLRDVFSIAAIANGAIALGSLYPLPFIDGGSLLKWQLVKTGSSPQKADETVKRTNIGLGLVIAVIGSLFAIRKLLVK